MAKDELTYSEGVRTAATEAGAALRTLPEVVQVTPAVGTLPEAVRQRAPRAHRRPGNSGKAPVPLDVDAQRDKPVPRKGRDIPVSRALFIWDAVTAARRCSCVSFASLVGRRRVTPSSPAGRARSSHVPAAVWARPCVFTGSGRTTEYLVDHRPQIEASLGRRVSWGGKPKPSVRHGTGPLS